jgi:PTS system fructose-specific IIC component
MLPVLMIGALGKAIPILFGQGSDPTNPIFKAFLAAGNFGFNMFIPVLAAYISFAIADLPGLAPGLIIGLIAKDGGSGYLGGLLGGFLAGYMTYTIMGLSYRFPKTL